MFEVTKHERLVRTSTYLVDIEHEDDAVEWSWDSVPEYEHEKTLDTDWEVRKVQND